MPVVFFIAAIALFAAAQSRNGKRSTASSRDRAHVYNPANFVNSRTLRLVTAGPEKIVWSARGDWLWMITDEKVVRFVEIAHPGEKTTILFETLPFVGSTSLVFWPRDIPDFYRVDVTQTKE